MSAKISFVMNVLNAEPFIGYQLASIYPYAHEIIIVEGAYQKFSHASTADGHSIDGTLETIQNFVDPGKKIILVPHDGFWKSRLEMCNGFLPGVTGDIIWQIDADEFYMSWVYEYIIGLFEEDETLDRVSFRVREFFASLKYEMRGSIDAFGLTDVRRVHRFQKGDRWASQRPPTLIDEKGNPKRMRREISAEEMAKKGIFIFHPTTLFEKQTFDKFKFYRQLWKGYEGIEQKDKWLHDTWYHFKNPLRLHGTTKYACWIERYNDPIPQQLEEMMNDVIGGKYIQIKVRDNSDIECYLESKLYQQDVFMGKTLNSLLDNIRDKNFFNALKQTILIIFWNIKFPFRVTARFCLIQLLRYSWEDSKRHFIRYSRRMVRLGKAVLRKLLPIRFKPA